MPTDSKQGRSADDFKKLHDKSFIIPEKIKAELAALGKDRWEYEGDFIKRCSPVSQSDFARFREPFSDHFFEVRASNNSVKRVWCGSKEFATKLRESLPS